MPDGFVPSWPLAAVVILSYLIGSIPFGLLLTRLAGGGDIRKIGSGNIGATNVLRSGRKGLAAATLLLDGGKGALAVGIAGVWDPPAMVLAGAAAVLGHLCPVWLRFHGGKGVATTLGVLLAVAWPAGVIACLVWLLVAWATRFSSLAALVAIGTAPLAAWLIADATRGLLALFMAILVFIRHEANIRRLLSGTETRIGARTAA